MTQHISSGAFVPSLELVQLSKSASKYIFNGMEKENKKLEMIHTKNKEDWTDYDKTENTSSVMRRFYLMQIDIITLGSSRYLGDYLADIQKF